MTSDVEVFLDSVENDHRRVDCLRLLDLMGSVTGERPVLWQSSIIGFGPYHYKYASGREGDFFKVGFSPRKANLTVYLLSGFVGYEDLLDQLGPHKTAKSCLYIKRLDDVDPDVLAELIRRCVAHIDQVYGDLGAIPRMSDMPDYQE